VFDDLTVLILQLNDTELVGTKIGGGHTRERSQFVGMWRANFR